MRFHMDFDDDSDEPYHTHIDNPRTDVEREQCLKNCRACRKDILRWAFRRHANKEKNRERVREKVVGVTQAQVNTMLDRQGFLCAICGAPDGSGGKKYRRHAVDHCHKSGLVRGMLCGRCNLGLGYFRDSIQNLQEAVQYLLNNQPPTPPKGEPNDVP